MDDGSTLIVLLFFLLTVVIEVLSELTPVLNTPNGPVIGSRKIYNGFMTEEYLGIPFAKPPLGNLRFAKPQPVSPWTLPLDATKYSQHCTHFISYVYPVLGYGAKNGEDCLYINIFVPGGVENNLNRRRPVMIWVYGGAFFFGTGEMYPGQALAQHGDMIVVTFNYRIGPLGFLSTGDAELPGNYGLWDQNAAFKWVKDNIAAFGGDPSKVTIFGQSAGGASVSHAVVSPHSAGLFQSAIAISGAANSYFAITNRSLEAAMILGDLCGCNAHNSKELKACLLKQDAAALDLFGAGLTIPITKKIMNFVPVVDGDYIPYNPRQLFELGAGKDINFVTGSAYHDIGGFVILNIFGTPGLQDFLNLARTTATMKTFLRLLLGPVDNLDEAFDEIVKVYPNMNSLDETTRTKAMIRAITEWIFGSATNWEAERHSQSSGTGKTFQYLFRYRQSFLTGYPGWFNGSHMDDIYSVLGEPWMKVYRERALLPEFSDTDKDVSSNIMDYYSNVAHSGNPNLGLFNPILEWKEFQVTTQNFLQESQQFIEETFYTDKTKDRYKFWTDVFPGILKFPPQPKFPPASDLGIISGIFNIPIVKSLISETDLLLAVEQIKTIIRSMFPNDQLWNEFESRIDAIMATLGPLK